MRTALCLDFQSVYCQKQEKLSSWSWTLAASIVLLLALAFKVWVGISITAVGYELARERERAVSGDMERREYELQLSVLLRPDNLEKRAREVLEFEKLDPKKARKISY